MLLLRSQHPFGDEAVHQVRKDVKRARAALRLLRDAVTDTAYRKENARLRDAARPLARIRDVTAMLETIGRLASEKEMRPHRAALARLRAELRDERAQLHGRLEGGPVARRVGEALEESKQRVGRWRLPPDGWPILRDGLRRIYRKKGGARSRMPAKPGRTKRCMNRARR